MTRESNETETLAMLYLEQGFPHEAAAIFGRILKKDPKCRSALLGLSRCREAIRLREVDPMQREARLNVLRQLLARLTGETFEEPPEAQAIPLAKEQREVPQKIQPEASVLSREALPKLPKPTQVPRVEVPGASSVKPVVPSSIPVMPGMDIREQKLIVLRQMLARLTGSLSV